MNNPFYIGKKEIGWVLVLIIFFILTLKLGIWYGSKKTLLETKTVVVQTEIDNIILRDKVAALDIEVSLQKQKISAMIGQMQLIDSCMKRKWRGCYN